MLNDQTSALLAANSTNICLYSSKQFCDILLECRKLDSQSIYTAASTTTAPLINANNPTSHPAQSQQIVDNDSQPGSAAVAVAATDDGDAAENAASVADSTDSISNNRKRVTPTVSINVTDTENLSVCMCSLLYASSDTIPIEQESMGDSSTICPRCRNIIERHSSEPRRTLISKRLTLANDIIVNRVDTHFLNLKPYQCGRQYEPYTPETIESHSPATEIDDIPTSDDVDDDDEECKQCDANVNDIDNDDNDYNAKKRGSTLSPTIGSSGVSPGQLKARLEKLRLCTPDTPNSSTTTSELSMIVKQSNSNDDHQIKMAKNRSSSKCCASRYCVIL